MSKEYKAKFYRLDFEDESDVIYPAGMSLKSVVAAVLYYVGDWRDHYLVTIHHRFSGRVVRRVCFRSGHDRRKSDRR